MKYCTNCGTESENESRFCTECGQEIQPVPESRNCESPAPADSAMSGACSDSITQPPSHNKGSKHRILPLILAGILVIGIVIGFLFLKGGNAGGNPDLGLYNAVSSSYGGFETQCDGDWIELKAGGKLNMMLMGDAYTGKWKLDGKKLTVTNAEGTYYGTLEGNILTLDLSGVLYTYEKDTGSSPSASESTVTPVTDPSSAPSLSEVGYWTLKYWDGDAEFAMDEETVAMLKEMGIVIYLELREDGTGTLMIDAPFEINWADGQFTAEDGSSLPYTLENGELIVDIDGSLMHFVPDQKGSAPETEDPDRSQISSVTYVAVSGTVDGTVMDEQTLNTMGGVTLTFLGDGTGTFDMFGQSESITYDGEGVMHSGSSMSYQLEGDYLYLTVSETTDFIMMDQSALSGESQNARDPGSLSYWEGDYYGWWMFDSIIVGDSENEGRWWDCCMSLEIEDDGSGSIVIWDQDFGKDDPIAIVDISASLFDGAIQIVSESGDFMGCPVGYEDWIFYSDEMDYENTFGFTVTYQDEFNEIECFFFLRSWGTIWDDVEEDYLPGFYDNWYLPLIRDGVTTAPGTIG